MNVRTVHVMVVCSSCSTSHSKAMVIWRWNPGLESYLEKWTKLGSLLAAPCCVLEQDTLTQSTGSDPGSGGWEPSGHDWKIVD